jgi:kinesin family protein 4/21/27
MVTNSSSGGNTQQVSKALQFDYVFDDKSDQEQIYSGAKINDMVQNVVDGFHSTIFCYGQTGSGKSYTMDGLKYS